MNKKEFAVLAVLVLVVAVAVPLLAQTVSYPHFPRRCSSSFKTMTSSSAMRTFIVPPCLP